MSAYNAGDLGSIPWSGRSSGEGNGNPLQYSCLENPMDRGTRMTTVHGVTEPDMTEQLCMHAPKRIEPHGIVGKGHLAYKLK